MAGSGTRPEGWCEDLAGWGLAGAWQASPAASCGCPGRRRSHHHQQQHHQQQCRCRRRPRPPAVRVRHPHHQPHQRRRGGDLLRASAGAGEAIVSGTVPGAALTFVARKDDMDNPRVLLYPSKSEGMFVDESLIFRSDSNGEDLEGYAGAGAGAAGRSSGGWRSGLCAAVFSARPLRWSAGRLPGHTPSHTSLSPLPSHTPVPPPPPPPHPYRRPVRLCDHRHHCAPQGRLLLRPAHDRPRVPGAPHAGHLPRGAGHRAGAGVGAGGREGRVCVWAGGPGGSRAPHWLAWDWWVAAGSGAGMPGNMQLPACPLPTPADPGLPCLPACAPFAGCGGRGGQGGQGDCGPDSAPDVNPGHSTPSAPLQSTQPMRLQRLQPLFQLLSLYLQSMNDRRSPAGTSKRMHPPVILLFFMWPRSFCRA